MESNFLDVDVFLICNSGRSRCPDIILDERKEPPSDRTVICHGHKKILINVFNMAFVTVDLTLSQKMAKSICFKRTFKRVSVK